MTAVLSKLGIAEELTTRKSGRKVSIGCPEDDSFYDRASDFERFI